MEKQSIGMFISNLRRGSGMTQKDLADRLGVSDKTVSHWERDESAPDLMLIPAIAEMFGITCDELLRCDRVKDASEEKGKAEKQGRHFPDVSRKKFKRRSVFSLCLSILGLFAAFVCNFGHSGAYISFIVGCIFYMFAAISESIFYSYALYAAGGEGFDGAELNDYKMYVVQLAGKIMSVPVIMLGASLPLVIFPYNIGSYIYASEWIGWGILTAAAAAVVCMCMVYIVNNKLIKKGVYALVKSTDIKRHKVNRLKVLCTAVTAAVIFALILGQTAFSKAYGWQAFTTGTAFNNCDDFKAYMEKGDLNLMFQDNYYGIRPYYYGPQPTGAGDYEYFDENGNSITKEQALANYVQAITEYVYDDAGNVVCQYVRLNRDVSDVEYSGANADKFSATVYTGEQYNAGHSIRNLIDTVWIGSYFAAIGIGLLMYFKKRVKLG